MATDTVTMTTPETEVAKLDVPPNCAEIESAPTGSVDKLIVATPVLFTVPVPRVLPPLRKVTTPVDTGAPPLVTAAVKVTGSPEVTFAKDALRAVAVAAATGAAIVTVTGFEAEAAKLPAPP